MMLPRESRKKKINNRLLLIKSCQERRLASSVINKSFLIMIVPVSHREKSLTISPESTIPAKRESLVFFVVIASATVAKGGMREMAQIFITFFYVKVRNLSNLDKKQTQKLFY
jgi:hypothetical protein